MGENVRDELAGQVAAFIRAGVDQEVGIVISENVKLRDELAAAQAQIKMLKEKTEQKKKSNLNEITDISTFRSTDKLKLERKNIFHFFVASSQYYKMEKRDHNLTITYMENGKLQRNFEKLKEAKDNNGEHFEELLLFHGTDEENVNSIFNNNFDIEHHPLRRSKVDIKVCSLLSC